MKFIICNRVTFPYGLTSVAANYRSVPIWLKSGVVLALGKDIKTEITQRADKSYATQVYAAMSIGATRMEEAKVVQVLCTE